MSSPAASAFTRRSGHLLLELPGGTVLFSSGVDGGDPEGLAALEQAAGIPEERWATDLQVHGTAVRRIARPEEFQPMTGEFDGQATTLTGVAVVVRTADCLPVALVAPEAVAMVHAGWRGLAAGVVQEGLAAMRELGATEVRAAIGPAAGVCCYEAGDEVHAALAPHGEALRDGRNADLPGVAAAILREGGVSEVHDAGLCTICAPDGLLHSYRRTGTAARNLGLAWRS